MPAALWSSAFEWRVGLKNTEQCKHSSQQQAYTNPQRSPPGSQQRSSRSSLRGRWALWSPFKDRDKNVMKKRLLILKLQPNLHTVFKCLCLERCWSNTALETHPFLFLCLSFLVHFSPFILRHGEGRGQEDRRHRYKFVLHVYNFPSNK